MIKFIKECEEWLYKKPLYWSYAYGFLTTFVLGFLFLSSLAILGYALYQSGNSSLPSAFFGSKKFSITFIISIVFLISIFFVAPKQKQAINAMNRKHRFFPFERKEKIKKGFREILLEKYKYIDNSIKKFIIQFWNWFSRPTTIIAMLIILISFLIFIWDGILAWLGLDILYGNTEQTAHFFRNRSFAFAASLGFLITILGMGLTIWGRIQTQKQTEQTQEQIELSRKANASERYENAAKMLGNSVLAVRIAGCHALRSLGQEDKGMGLQCIQLLLLFISTPYLDEGETKIIKDLVSKELLLNNILNLDEKKLAVARKLTYERKMEKLFPIDEPLRLDIQAAADAFTAICEHYYNIKDEKLKLGDVNLPSYFWKNSKKEKIALPNSNIVNKGLEKAYLKGANLSGANLFKANLFKAELSEANLRDAILNRANLLQTDLSHADLSHADLSESNLSKAILFVTDLVEANLSAANLSKAKLFGTELSGANMENVKELTPDQIILATWGFKTIGFGMRQKLQSEENPKVPRLPEEFLKNNEVKKWLIDPHYEKKSKNKNAKPKKSRKVKAKKAKAKAKARKSR